MRCQLCDTILSDYESTIRDKETGDYKDTCSKCMAHYKPTFNKSSLIGIVPDDILNDIEQGTIKKI